MGNVNRTLGFDVPTSRASFDCYVNSEQCDASELTSSSTSSHSCKTSRAVSTRFSESVADSQQSVLELLLSEVRQLRIDVDGIKDILRSQENSGHQVTSSQQAQTSEATASETVEKIEQELVRHLGELECPLEIDENVEVVNETKSDLSKPTSVYSVAVESI